MNRISKEELSKLVEEASTTVDAPIPAETKPAATPSCQIAGCDVFDVDADTFFRCRFGKEPRKWWSKFLNTPGMPQYFKMRENKNAGVMVRYKNHMVRVL